MSPVVKIACLAALLVPVLAGCSRNPFLTPQQQAVWQQQQQQQPAVMAQVDELRRRVDQLDANNRDLHAQLAQSQQQVRVYRDQVELLQTRLQDTANQLQQTQTARQQAEQKVESLLASTQRRGGATITANNSLQKTLETVSVAGLNVRQEGDVIRIELPSDQLFRPGTAQVETMAYTQLDQVADVITRKYPRQRVGIEGHTDSDPAFDSVATTTYQLSSQQALAVFDLLTRRNRLPSKQLFVMALGSNYPRASNATAAGRAANRRIEVVIYPEEF